MLHCEELLLYVVCNCRSDMGECEPWLADLYGVLGDTQKPGDPSLEGAVPGTG